MKELEKQIKDNSEIVSEAKSELAYFGDLEVRVGHQIFEINPKEKTIRVVDKSKDIETIIDINGVVSSTLKAKQDCIYISKLNYNNLVKKFPELKEFTKI